MEERPLLRGYTEKNGTAALAAAVFPTGIAHQDYRCGRRPERQVFPMDFYTQAKQLVSQMTLEEKISQLQHESPAIERLGIPAYNGWNECLHGLARSGYVTDAGTFGTA